MLKKRLLILLVGIFYSNTHI